MRIKKVNVSKLFGIFNHEIAMKMDEHITIIHAPNGFGKTAILRMIDGLFNSHYTDLRAFPFSSFAVELDNGKVLSVQKHKNTKTQGKHKSATNDSEKIIISCNGSNSFELGSSLDPSKLRFPLEIIERIIPELDRIGPEHWRSSEGEILSLIEVLDRYHSMLPFTDISESNLPPWFLEIKQSIDVRFIRSERLVSHPLPQKVSRRESRSILTPTVMSYSNELASEIKTTLTKYAELSQSLDRTFPVRLVNESPTSGLTQQEITNRLSEFEMRRKHLIESGILDQGTDPQFQVLPTFDDTKASVLSVYICDIQDKLAVFDVLAEKIDLFQKIINSRFKHKNMSISRDNGLTFTTDLGQPLSAANLSSGEQHEVVMLYELIFKVQKDSLILIDEPEISLHVAWQEEFLRDLQGMTQLSKFDVLIATHSPQIISDRWDLSVELKDAADIKKDAS